MNQPLAVDLFCGLFQAEFFRRTNASVEKPVACWAQNPNHVRLRIRSKSPRSASLVRWTMGYLKNTRFTAGLAGAWHVRPSSGESVKRHVLEFPIRFIKRSPFFIFTSRPLSAEFSRCRISAIYGAISLVRAWRNNFKVLSASTTLGAVLSSAFVFLPSDSSSPSSAIISTPLFVWSDRLEWIFAELTDQVVHRNIITWISR
jgi:hypothetical protein